MTRSAVSGLCRCEQDRDPALLPLTLPHTALVLLPAVTSFLGGVPACGRIRPAVLSAAPLAKNPKPSQHRREIALPSKSHGVCPLLIPLSLPAGAALNPAQHRASSRDSNQGDRDTRKSLLEMQIFPRISCTQHPRGEQCRRCGHPAGEQHHRWL